MEMDAKSNTKLYLILAGSGGAFVTLLVLGVVVVWIFSAAGKAKITPVTDFVNYDSPEDVFHVDLPKDWEQQNGGKKSIYFVEATRGRARIKVNENITGSLIGDIAGAANPDLNGPDETLPVSKAHDFKRPQFEADFSGYQEEPAVTIRNGFGKTRRSTFTGKMGWVKVKGYRATAMSVQTQITVTCSCTQSDWNIAEPAFARAIESIGYGPGPIRK
jgi:hypothetical protein